MLFCYTDDKAYVRASISLPSSKSIVEIHQKMSDMYAIETILSEKSFLGAKALRSHLFRWYTITLDAVSAFLPSVRQSYSTTKTGVLCRNGFLILIVFSRESLFFSLLNKTFWDRSLCPPSPSLSRVCHPYLSTIFTVCLYCVCDLKRLFSLLLFVNKIFAIR